MHARSSAYYAFPQKYTLNLLCQHGLSPRTVWSCRVVQSERGKPDSVCIASRPKASISSAQSGTSVSTRAQLRWKRAEHRKEGTKKEKKRNPLDANNAHNLTLAYHRECTTCARVCFCTQEDHVLSSGAHVIYCLDTAETCLRMFHAWQPHVWVTRALFMSRSVGLKRHGLVCVCTAVSWEQDFFFYRQWQLSHKFFWFCFVIDRFDRGNTRSNLKCWYFINI